MIITPGYIDDIIDKSADVDELIRNLREVESSIEHQWVGGNTNIIPVSMMTVDDLLCDYI